VISAQTSYSSAKQAIGISLLSFGFLCTLFAVSLNLKTTIEVARRSPSRARHPLRNLSESLDARRVYADHEKHFPGSRRRTVVNVLGVTGLVCFFIGTQLLIAQ
jgi:hypothetical protein